MEYHKIQTLFARNPEDLSQIIVGEWARPEFQYLSHLHWEATEKIDGTNIRVIWNGEDVEFRGRTDRAQIPTKLQERLTELFPTQKLSDALGNTYMILYGEGYGGNIQRAGKFYGDINFILFDVLANNQWWLESLNVRDVAYKLGINVTPTIWTGDLYEIVWGVFNGLDSRVAEKELVSEGIVARPIIQLFNRKGERIITKLKTRDFSGVDWETVNKFVRYGT